MKVNAYLEITMKIDAANRPAAARVYTDYRAQKAKAAELQKVKSNLAAILRQEQTKEKRQDLDR